MSDVIPPFKKNFSDSTPHMAKSLRECIQNDIDTSENTKIFCLKSYHIFNINLPNLSLYPEGFRHFYLMNVVDGDIKQDLQENKVINWCRSAKKLHPLKTKGDGNCLLHAISLCLWGLEDDQLLLRRLLYVVLVQDTSTQKNFQRRWLLRQRRMNQERPVGFGAQLDSNEWEREWDSITKAAMDKQNTDAFLPYDTLEAVHLYALANILRRPIIVLANRNVRSVYGSNVQECNLSGIYLPLEWKDKDTFPSPILIGYSMNHFVPLVTKQSGDRENDGEFVVPLVMNDLSPLVVHFLLPDEEPIVQDLFKMYLKVKSVPMTTQDSVLQIPVAKLEFQTIQDHHNLIHDHVLQCMQIYMDWSQPRQQAQGPPIFVNNEVRTVDTETGCISCHSRCKQEKCEMYGAPSLGGFCNNCFMDYTRQYRNMEQFEDTQKQQGNLPQPTAPPPSISNRSVYDMSMMEEQCATKCGNRASTKTYPYCHECHPAESHGHVSPTMPLSLHETMNKGLNEPIDEHSLFGGGKSKTPPQSGHNLNRTHPQLGNSFSKMQPGHMHKQCSSPRCRENCLTLQANKCAKCFVTSGYTDFNNSFSNQPSPVQSGPSSQTYVMNDLSGAQNPPSIRSINPEDLHCKTHNCPNPPHYFLGGYCNECANKAKQKTETFSVRTADRKEDKVIQTSTFPMASGSKNICLTPGCINKMFEGGLCQSCFRAANRESFSEFEQEMLVESATPCEVPQREEVNPVVTSHKDKIKCASPVCHNMIYPPNQMCADCTAILSDAHARCRSTEHRRLSPVQQGACYSPSRQRCHSTGCQFYGDPRTNGYCSKCYEKDKKNKMRPISKPKKGTVCMEPGCDKYGDASMHYRCTFHYNVLTSMYSSGSSVPYLPGSTPRPTPTNRTAPSIHYETSSSLTGPHYNSKSAPMLPSQVERFNVPEREPMNNLSRPGSSTSQVGAGIEQKYSQAMSKVEREQKSLTICKSRNCTNFGNSQKEGFCNSCYTEVQRQRLFGNAKTSDKPLDHYCC